MEEEIKNKDIKKDVEELEEMVALEGDIKEAKEIELELKKSQKPNVQTGDTEVKFVRDGWYAGIYCRKDDIIKVSKDHADRLHARNLVNRVGGNK